MKVATSECRKEFALWAEWVERIQIVGPTIGIKGFLSPTYPSLPHLVFPAPPPPLLPTRSKAGCCSGGRGSGRAASGHAAGCGGGGSGGGAGGSNAEAVEACEVRITEARRQVADPEAALRAALAAPEAPREDGGRLYHPVIFTKCYKLQKCEFSKTFCVDVKIAGMT